MAPASASVLFKCVHLCLSVSHMSILHRGHLFNSLFHVDPRIFPGKRLGGMWAWEEGRARVRACGHTLNLRWQGRGCPPSSALP